MIHTIHQLHFLRKSITVCESLKVKRKLKANNIPYARIVVFKVGGAMTTYVSMFFLFLVLFLQIYFATSSRWLVFTGFLRWHVITRVVMDISFIELCIKSLTHITLLLLIESWTQNITYWIYNSSLSMSSGWRNRHVL